MLFKKVKTSCSISQLVKTEEEERKTADFSVGSRWRVCVLTEGLSENNVFYPADVIQNDYKGIAGINSYLYHLDAGSSMVFDHLPVEFLTVFDAPLMGHLFGWFSSPQIETIDGKIAATAELYIHRSAQQMREFFLDCWEHGKEIGFSITALTGYSDRIVDEKPVHWVEKIWYISCDPVSYPAVKGARMLRLLESCNKSKEVNIMDANVLKSLLEVGKKISPELSVKGQTQNDAVAYCSHLIESLSARCFPDSPVRQKLISVREALEKEDNKKASEELEKIKMDIQTGSEIHQSVEKLKTLLSTSKFQEASDASGFCASALEKVDDAMMKEKLISLKTLIDSKEWEAALEYIDGILDMLAKDMYPETYPTAYPSPAEVYPSPAEVYPSPAEVYPLPPEEMEAPPEPPIEAAASITLPSVEKPPAVAVEQVGNIIKESEKMETPGVRVTRIELENILKGSCLPLPAQEKISTAVGKTETSRESILQMVEDERAYLRKVGLPVDAQETEIAQAVRIAMSEVKTAFEKEATAFKNEIATFRESATQAQNEFKTELKVFKESSLKAQTQELVKKLVRESFLPSVCAKRVELMFVDKVATEDEVKAAIRAESALTSEVIADIASTVTGFGSESPVTDEDSAQTYIEKFFDSRLSV